MTLHPTPRAAAVLAIAASAAPRLPVATTAGLLGAIGAATMLDALLARRPPRVEVEVPNVVVRGRPAPFALRAASRGDARVLVRQPAPPDVTVTPAVGAGHLDSRLVARRRGRHTLPAPAVRQFGPLGLGASTSARSGPRDLLVYPDVHTAERLATAVRQGRFRDEGRRRRGPLGLGTDFESVRDYLPDDDVRQINWQASARLGRPMSNQYRVEQDRDIVCVLDAGRLMAAPIGDETRLDLAADAVTAVAKVADAVGDRCGVTVFDREVRRRVAPRRAGGDAVVHAILDVEPALVDSDFDLAFRTVGGSKRALVLVYTDLVDEAAARPLLGAVPVLARRHAVVVASILDPDVDGAVGATATTRDVYTAAVAVDVLAARRRVVATLRSAGAEVVEAAPHALPEACIAAYLRLKSRARL